MATSAVGKEDRKLNLESVEYQGLTWLHIEKPTKAETEYLGQHFPFDPLNLQDVLSRHIRPKIDEYSNHLFSVMHFPNYNEESHAIISVEMDVFIGDGYLVTIDCTGQLKALSRLFKTCQSDEKARKENLGRGSGFLFYRILDDRIDRRLLLLDRIGDNIEAAEAKVFCEKAPGLMREIAGLRRDVVSFRRAVWAMKDVLGSLGTKVGRFSHIDLKDYFEDMAGQLDRIWDSLNECKEIVEGLYDTYNSMATDRTNEILRTLTALMLIGSILTVYVGYYGMNIPLGPVGGANPGGHPLAWLWLLVIGVVLTAIMVIYAIRKGWI